jgi:RNA polymerase sigma-70 factor (ECF subfamily)
LADPFPDDPDVDLLPAAVAGDPDAFAGLVRRYQRRMVSLARTVGGAGDDAEDVSQEVFVRVYKALGAFRGESSFRRWLYTIAVNVLRSHGARRRRQQTVWDESGARDSVPFDPPDPKEFEVAWMVRDAVERALDDLPEPLRVAVTLRDVHGLDYRDIAETTGVPIGTVESRIFRARQRLRAALGSLRPR